MNVTFFDLFSALHHVQVGRDGAVVHDDNTGTDAILHFFGLGSVTYALTRTTEGRIASWASRVRGSTASRRLCATAASIFFLGDAHGLGRKWAYSATPMPSTSSASTAPAAADFTVALSGRVTRILNPAKSPQFHETPALMEDA